MNLTQRRHTKIIIHCHGDTQEDIQLGIEAAIHSIEQGYLSGADSNGTGNYSFDVYNSRNPADHSNE